MRLKLHFILTYIVCLILLWGVNVAVSNGAQIPTDSKEERATAEEFSAIKPVSRGDADGLKLPNYSKLQKVNPSTGVPLILVEAPLLDSESTQKMTKIKSTKKDTSVISKTVKSIGSSPKMAERSLLFALSNNSSVTVGFANQESRKNKKVDEIFLISAFNPHDANVVDNVQSKTNQVPKMSLNINNKNKSKKFNNTLTNKKSFTDTLKPTTVISEPQANSLPEIITEVPIVTVTDLPKETVDPTQNNASDPEIGRDGTLAVENIQRANETNGVTDSKKKGLQADDDPKLQINDPGGGVTGGGLPEQNEDINNPNIMAEATMSHSEELSLLPNNTSVTSHNGTNGQADFSTVNLTVEEVPIPVFSEWAQKQMEAEASKMQALEQEQLVANNSVQRRNNTISNGKPQQLKVRAKNYASPDCGGKIIAANPDADHIGAVLTNSRDEYMLNPCGTRIWFVVELCEAIQAQKVELANFELFSSSPKNFTVAVSNRFPTRDWSNVGRFTAEDKRNVQSFDLYPHLFGKFVRIDIHTHYSKEHFCPVSLFRAFGTSEFEAFETEIRAGNDLDDFDDEEEQAQAKRTDNIFKSASDAVLQMVKKAAEVLVKPSADTLRQQTLRSGCLSPSFGQFSCTVCNVTLVERINFALSCEFNQLQKLIGLSGLRNHLLTTRTCAEDYGIDLLPMGSNNPMAAVTPIHKNQSYFLNILPDDFIGALCKLLTEQVSTKKANIYENSTLLLVTTTNLADKKEQLSTQFGNDRESRLSKTKSFEGSGSPLGVGPIYNECIDTSTESNSTTAAVHADQGLQTENIEITADGQLQQSSESELALDKSKSEQENAVGGNKPTAAPTPAPDVNIFNIGAVETTESQAPLTNTLPLLTDEVGNIETIPVIAGADGLIPAEATGRNSEEDSSNWDSIDNLLTTTVASLTAGGSAAAAAVAMNSNLPDSSNGATHMHHKLSNSAQSESVFIRLSNRVKALERNMSLSGQYLEELSRRYKKQVEELQQLLSQQTLSVRSLEEQSRRLIEQENLYQLQNSELSSEVRNLTFQVQFCVGVFIFVGACIFLMFALGYVYYRKLRRETQELALINAASRIKLTNVTKPKQRQLYRRKSYEDFSDQSIVINEKQRRPSEEAMLLILKDCGNDLTTDKSNFDDATPVVGNKRQRKISVCHSNNFVVDKIGAKATSLGHARKRGTKHPWQRDSEVPPVNSDEDTFFDIDTNQSSQEQLKILQLNGENSKPSKLSKKKNYTSEQQPPLKRQASAPSAFTNGSLVGESNNSDFEEHLILDDDDLDNFIPNSDLAYNEFMPEGPSGYQIVDSTENSLNSKKNDMKPSRRLSSPAFFKSPFGKIMSKSSMSAVKSKAHSVHEPTAWEWYRLKRSASEAQQNHAVMPTTPIASLDASSLSEINFPINSTQNSFRILEEAILTSGAVGASSKRNTNGNASSSSSGSGSNRSTSSISSITAKKKSRTFNRIFRNVF